MRTALGVWGLMLFTMFTSRTDAAVYRVWVDPAIHSHGWTTPEVIVGIHEGLRRWEEICNLRFDVVDQEYGAEILIRCGELYEADGTPQGGYCKGRTLWLHTGRSPGAAWQPFESLEHLARVVAHEVGHFFGLKHSADRTSLMHPNAPSWFSAREIAWARRRFGAPVAALKLYRLPNFKT